MLPHLLNVLVEKHGAEKAVSPYASARAADPIPKARIKFEAIEAIELAKSEMSRI
jgi:hypothetical protein